MAVTQDNLGHYEIRGEAGRGAMSVVYEALDTRIGRRVALKVLSPAPYLSSEQEEDRAARLRREARAVACLSHPNVVTIYDVGEDGGRQFLVMEYLEGMTLRARLDRGPLSPDEASRVLQQVAAGLDAVHAAGVVHRDLKPANVMLLSDGRVKLMDFGVARGEDDTMVTQAGTMVGSPVYMAPEQTEGGVATPASDRWALGVLLYEMLAGQPPFPGKNIPLVLYQVAHARPQPLPGASARVQSVLNRALEKDPARRYPSAGALADAFAAAIDGKTGRRAPRLPRAAAVVPTAPRPARRATPAVWLVPLLLLGALAGVALHRYWPDTRTPPAVSRVPHAVPATPRHTRLVAAHTPPHAAPTPPAVRVAAAREEQTFPQRRRVRRLPATTARPVRAASRAPRRAVTVGPVRSPSPPRALAVRPVRSGRRHRQLVASSPAAAFPPRQSAPTIRRVHARPHVPEKPAPETAVAATGAGPRLLGTWHGWQGIHGRDPAVLTISRQQGNSFGGVMTVNTPEHATVRVALAGRVLPGGRVAIRETRILSSTKPHAWDLGFKTGQMTGSGLSGVDHDVRGRTAHWSFSR